MSKKVLVTGGTGFLGSHLLVQLLKKGYTIRALRRTNSRMDLVKDIAGSIEWVEGDILDIVSLEDAMEGIEQVYHCAAMVSFHSKDRARLFTINVDGTANVVNAALDAGVQKLVHVSSIAALGRDTKRPNLDDSSKWVESPANTQYAISKYRGEMEAWRGQAEGLDVAVAVPAMVLGAGFWNENTARFFVQIRDGLKFWPSGNSGYVDVRDVAKAMILMMERPEKGQKYLLCAENFSYKGLFDKIATSINAKAPMIKVTRLLAEVAWRVEWLKEKILGIQPMVTKESARTSMTTFYYDGTRAQQDLGLNYTPIDETIKTMGMLFQKNNIKPCRMP